MSQQPDGGTAAPPEMIYVIRHGEKPAGPPAVLFDPATGTAGGAADTRDTALALPREPRQDGGAPDVPDH